MTITITHEDIRNGRRCDPDCCPVGRALSRAGIDHYGVVGSTVMISDGVSHATGLPLPEPVRVWILNFDGNQPVEPISFELNLPEERKATARRGRRPGPARLLAAA